MSVSGKNTTSGSIPVSVSLPLSNNIFRNTRRCFIPSFRIGRVSRCPWGIFDFVFFPDFLLNIGARIFSGTHPLQLHGSLRCIRGCARQPQQVHGSSSAGLSYCLSSSFILHAAITNHARLISMVSPFRRRLELFVSSASITLFARSSE